jgi:hypothetical protein
MSSVTDSKGGSKLLTAIQWLLIVGLLQGVAKADLPVLSETPGPVPPVTTTPSPVPACGTFAAGTLAVYAFNGTLADPSNGNDLLPWGGTPTYNASNCSGTGTQQWAGIAGQPDEGLWEGSSFTAAFGGQTVYSIEGYFYTGAGTSQQELVSCLSGSTSGYSFDRQEYLTWDKDEQGVWSLFWEDSCLSGVGIPLPEEAGGENGDDIVAIEFPPMAAYTCYQVAVTYDNGTINVYLDGKNVGSFTGGCPTPAFDGESIAFGMGQLSNGAGMDDWRISAGVARTSFPTQDAPPCLVQPTASPTPTVVQPGGNGQETGQGLGKSHQPTPGIIGPQLFAAPNPCENWTTFFYQLGEPGQVSVQLYDLTGAPVDAISAGYQPEGKGSIRFPLQHLAPGIYAAALVCDSGHGARVVDRFKLAVLR